MTAIADFLKKQGNELKPAKDKNSYYNKYANKY